VQGPRVRGTPSGVSTIVPPDLRSRLADVIGWLPTSFREVEGGYTPAARWIVTGREPRAFVKMATTPQTAQALRAEWKAYRALEGPFMPRVFAWDDDAEHPVLVLEDLSEARWPPPWDAELVTGVVATLQEVHSATAALPSFRGVHGSERNGWRAVEANVEPLVGLGLVSRRWLEESLPSLLRAAEEVRTQGRAVTHFDVRSDNLCRTKRGIVLVDWNCACLGNADLDLGFWLPSLAFEGGPSPSSILPERPDIAAWVCGFCAARAGLPPVPGAPGVRRVQREQLATALAWVSSELDLPPTTAG
jgi:thiamine kinase-like enzyme